MSWLSTLASAGVAIGSPLVYLDQYLSIKKTQSSEGFSHLICLVLLTANITRLYYWLGERFDTALLVQSILMIVAQFGLLRICLKYSHPVPQQHGPTEEEEAFEHGLGSLTEGADSPASLTLLPTSTPLALEHLDHFSPTPSERIASFFASGPQTFDYYIDFFALLFALQAGFFILLQRYDWYIQAIGFFSLGLESTLPLPQLVTNYRRKSLAGLSPMVLFGWLFGDSFKSVYLVFLTPDTNSIQFKVCALFQLSIDVLILGQALIYRKQTKLSKLGRSRSTSSVQTGASAGAAVGVTQLMIDDQHHV